MTEFRTVSDEPIRVAMIGLRALEGTAGGVEAAAFALAQELPGQDIDLTVYCRRAYVNTRLPNTTNARIVVLPHAVGPRLEAISHTALAISHALLRGRFDVVHLHALGPGLFAFLPRLCRKRTVVTVHGLDFAREKWGPVASAVLRLGAWLAGKVPHATIVVSRELSDWYAARGVATTLIPNGVPRVAASGVTPAPGTSDIHTRLAPDVPVVLFLGRLVPEKQVDVIIRAFEQIRAPAQLVIAGPLTDTDSYHKRLASLATANANVHLVGARFGADKALLLDRADLYVQASSVEGLPLALLEAAAHDVPCVVSDIRAHTEIVSIDSGPPLARVVPVGDVHSLAVALELALSPDGRATAQPDARRLGLHVRQRYSWPKIARQTAAVYRAARNITDSV